MLHAFNHFVSTNTLIAPHQTTLLALSGGADSTVMAELFHRAGHPFAIVHCNFKLRGNESDADEDFVSSLAKKYKVLFFTKHFDTLFYSSSNMISVQMAARDLRYTWFQQLASEHNFDLIATAHHQNDAIETVLINFTRGTGIAGLHGIIPKQNNLIRPLLFATREQIERFANDQHIIYRNDSSNSSDKYIRNKIRHQVIPLLKEINPAFEVAATTTIHHLRKVEEIYTNAINDGLKDVVTVNGDDICIALEKLNKLQLSDVYLYELLKQYGFNATQVSNLMESLKGSPGKQFFSHTHVLVIDRTKLIVSEIAKKNREVFLVNEDCGYLDLPFRATFNYLPATDFQLISAPETACLNAALLHYPLVIRKWQEGDFFYPLGMKRKKKLSDFFIDNKYALPDKKKIWVLVSNNNIVWIIGKRIDDRYKVTPDTTRVLLITLH